MNSNLKQAYNTVDLVIQEMLVDEEQALERICCLLESENSKLKSRIVEAVILAIRYWNKIPASEMKAKIEKIMSDSKQKLLDKT